MIRSELIARLMELSPDLTQKEATSVINAVFGEITEALVRGDRVEIRGFGAFSTVTLDARAGRNPRTGEPVEVAEKRSVRFRTGKRLHDRLNTGGGPEDEQT